MALAGRAAVAMPPAMAIAASAATVILVFLSIAVFLLMLARLGCRACRSHFWPGVRPVTMRNEPRNHSQNPPQKRCGPPLAPVGCRLVCAAPSGLRPGR